ncbi:KRAB-A domain-containing protein 2 [Trichoplax sp. H2]|nr:KRAB-A domain-containing protein 2 [Trichoplax sp. H2]|eukprot:RDD40124.1 KRAB-A domain-containing protein 2 [Trichoplax sp. H2]
MPGKLCFVKPGTNVIYVSESELFEVLQTVHKDTGHGGHCQRKKVVKSHALVTNPILSEDFNSRCQVDLIDFQSQPDREFRFIMVYQDHLTKFIQLRPLKTKQAKEVAEVLYKIFAIFGAPAILHSDNGREFVNATIEQLKDRWHGCHLVRGKPRHSQSQGSVERANQDVEQKLRC